MNMKKIIYLLMLLHTLAAFSQNQANIWYFGINAGIDFNSGAPAPLLDGALTSDEGSAVIADENGNLLFYTNGVTVWNKNHEVMENGDGLLSMTTSSQSALIVPKPGFGNTYYIFVVHYQGQGGLTYSEVDMDANGGLGRITNVKNVVLLDITSEQLNGTMHSNGTDVWIVVHGFGNNLFYSFRVTPQGINTVPVISTSGPVLDINNDMDSLGCMKLSPDGTKLAMATTVAGAYLYDFDNTTGAVSNGQLLSQREALYGVSFSPSGNVLYVTDSGWGGLLQFNLLANNIPASMQVFSDEEFMTSYGMQLGPDGKIYFLGPAEGLSVINNPDVVGPGCNWQLGGVSLGGRLPFLGLPNFIETYFLPTIYAEGFCLGSATQFTAGPGTPPQSAQWDFGDGATSQEASPQHIYNQPGTYTVTATAIIMGAVRTISKEITIVAPPAFNLGGPHLACVASNLQISPQEQNFNPDEATYAWEFNGQVVSTTATLIPQEFGTYSLTVTANGCTTTQNVVIQQQEATATFTQGCVNYQYTLAAAPDNESFNAATAVYDWQGPDGFTAQGAQAIIETPGQYTLTITTPEGCIIEHLWDVTDAACPLPVVPKGVSPNGDGRNDEFDLTLLDVAHLHVYNRYGLEVFSRENYTTQWYGQTNSRDELPDGTYYYSIQKQDGSHLTGWVYVNRQNQ